MKIKHALSPAAGMLLRKWQGTSIAAIRLKRMTGFGSMCTSALVT